MLRFYIEVARTAFRRQLIYRWANLAGLLTNAFFGIVSSSVLIALFQARHSAGGYDLRESLRYLWLAQSLVMVVLPFNWLDLMLTIRSGEVVSDLSKPCDFCWYWFSREIGRDIYYLLYRCIPTYAIGMLIFGIGLPGTWGQWSAFIAALMLGATLGIAFRFLCNIAAFWLLEARPISGLIQNLALFFTGLFIPLPFFPSWLRAFSEWLPSNGLVNVPVQVFVGKSTGLTLMFEIARQALWLVALVVAARLLTQVATRRVVSQGG